eukprot:COSAG02_NODE_1165_length_14156_cov_58.567191_8_plen_65_part_00
MYVVNVYMPHRGRRALHELVTTRLQRVVEQFDRRKAIIVVAGDFNARLGRNEQQHTTSQWLNWR